MRFNSLLVGDIEKVELQFPYFKRTESVTS